jgi:hypothetical protein
MLSVATFRSGNFRGVEGSRFDASDRLLLNMNTTDVTPAP